MTVDDILLMGAKETLYVEIPQTNRTAGYLNYKKKAARESTTT